MANLAAARLFAATVTPFAPDGHLDLDALAPHVERLLDAGVDGVVVAGTTGESASLSTAEKAELVRVVVGAADGRASVLVGTGERDTTEGIVQAGAGIRAGADGVLVSAPAVCRPSQAGLLAHVRAIADAADAPVMLYDNPRRFGVGFAERTLELASAHPNVWAIKDATDDPYRMADVLGTCDLAYFAGSDAAASVLSSGGQRLVGVGVNVDPAAYRAYVDALFRGDQG